MLLERCLSSGSSHRHLILTVREMPIVRPSVWNMAITLVRFLVRILLDRVVGVMCSVQGSLEVSIGASSDLEKAALWQLVQKLNIALF